MFWLNIGVADEIDKTGEVCRTRDDDTGGTLVVLFVIVVSDGDGGEWIRRS